MKQFKRQDNSKIRPETFKGSGGVSLSSRSSVSLQPELELTDPGDVYEQEADRMADRITGDVSAATSPTPIASRSVISRVPSGYASVSVPPSLEASISSSRGSGFSIPSALKARMESGFGADFSDVRFHTDSSADRMSSSIRANAFTSGKDIFFASGKYDPSSRSGQHLIAHELTHTLQQGGKIARQPSDDAPPPIVLPIPQRIVDKIKMEEREKYLKKNKFEIDLLFLLTHDPVIKKKGLSKKDAKIICRSFPRSFSEARWYETASWALEHILDNEGVSSISTDWITDYLDEEYSLFMTDYERALDVAMVRLAERMFEDIYLRDYNPGAANIKSEQIRVATSDENRRQIYGRLLKESKEEFAPDPFRSYVSAKYAQFSAPDLSKYMSYSQVNEILEAERKAKEKAIEDAKAEDERKQNKEYDAFRTYLIRRFFQNGGEVYNKSGFEKGEFTLKEFNEAFGYTEDGFDAKKRDTKQIFRLYQYMMKDLAKKATNKSTSSSELASAYQRLFDEATSADDGRFEGLERFVEYERTLVDYMKDREVYYYEYFDLPDNYVSAQTYTKLFFKVMTTALSFIPVGAFAGLGTCVAKASHFFTTSVVPKLIDVAVNESYDIDGTNNASEDLLISLLSLGIDSFFKAVPTKSSSVLGGLLKEAGKDSIQQFMDSSSEYLVKYVYGDDVGDWAIVTSRKAMEAFAKSLVKGSLKSAHKQVVYGKEIKEAEDIAVKADSDLLEGKIPQADYDTRMDVSNSIKDSVESRNDFAFQVEEETLCAVDGALGISESILDNPSEQETPVPVVVLPIYEFMTIDDF